MSYNCNPDSDNPGYLDCQTCPPGYHQSGTIGFGKFELKVCAPNSTNPDTDPAQDSDRTNCEALGYQLLGPDYLKYWELDPDGTCNSAQCVQQKQDAIDITKTYCNDPWKFATKAEINRAWNPMQQFMQSANWANNVGVTETRNCILDNFRGAHGNHRIGDDNLGDLSYYNLVAEGCASCSQWPNTDQCEIPPGPLPPPYPAPLDILNPIQGLCTIEESQKGLCKAHGGPFQPLRGISNPSFPSTKVVPVPHNLPTPWYDRWWDELWADLSEFYLTPDYVAGLLGATIPFWLVTQDLTKTLMFVGTGLTVPAGYITYLKTVKLIRDKINALKSDYAWLIDLEYPILAGFLGEGALAGLMALEWEVGLPIVLIGETGIYGTLVVIIGAAVVWFLNTEVGKGITSAGGWIFKGIDDLIG
jgi:hypothetical protein